MATYSVLMLLFLFYFWYVDFYSNPYCTLVFHITYISEYFHLIKNLRIVPESPRWLMTKNRNQEAYRIFRRIAQSNNKPCDELNELNALRRMASNGSSGREDLNSVSPMRTNAEENGTGESGEEKVTISLIKLFKFFN